MIEHTIWKRSLAALGATLLLGLTACGSSDDGGDAGEDPSVSDSASSDGTGGDDPTDEESSDASAPQTTKDTTKDGGFKYLPECEELSRSVVDGKDVADVEELAGRTCRFTIGDPVVGRQIVWIARGGGDWPTSFKAEELDAKLSEAADPGDKKYTTSVTEIDVPQGWDYGFQFDETIGKTERSSYRLMAFARNGDLLHCHTSASDADLDAFRSWCDEILTAVQP